MFDCIWRTLCSFKSRHVCFAFKFPLNFILVSLQMQAPREGSYHNRPKCENERKSTTSKMLMMASYNTFYIVDSETHLR